MLRRTTFLSIIFITVLCGLGFSRVGGQLDVSWFVLSAAVAIIFYLLRHKTKRARVGFIISACLCAFMLGWLRGSATMVKLHQYDLLVGQNVEIEATALEDSVYSDKGQMTFVIGSMFVEQPYRTKLIGELDVDGFGEPIIYRGDKVLVSGRLYKKRGGQQGGVSFAKIKLLTRSTFWVDDARRNFAAGLQNTLPEPLSSFGLGLLIGQRNTLSDSLNQELIAVGLIHIVAVSGYNLTVIIDISRKLFMKRSRFQSLVLSLLLIGLFLLLTGYSPSIVRAAIVSTLSLLAWYFGRKFKPVLLLSFVAMLTAFVNPLYPWSSIGWYLSFSAFFGILVLAPLLKSRYVSKKRQDNILPLILVETISAQLLTLPVILFIFGRLSVISILANVLVVPLVPLGMLFSLLAGIAGMTGFVFSGLIALPAEIILGYMLSISRLLSRLPFANIALSVDAVQMVFLYLLIGAIILFLRGRLVSGHDIIAEE